MRLHIEVDLSKRLYAYNDISDNFNRYFTKKVYPIKDEYEQDDHTYKILQYIMNMKYIFDEDINKFHDRWYKKSYRIEVYKFIEYIFKEKNEDDNHKVLFLRNFLMLEGCGVTIKNTSSRRKSIQSEKKYLSPEAVHPKYNLYNQLLFVKNGIKYFIKKDVFNVFSYITLLFALKDSLYVMYKEFSNYKENKSNNNNNNNTKDCSSFIIGRNNTNLFPNIPVFKETYYPKYGKRVPKNVYVYYGKRFEEEPNTEELEIVMNTIKSNIKYIHSFFKDFHFLSAKTVEAHSKSIDTMLYDILFIIIICDLFYITPQKLKNSFLQSNIIAETNLFSFNKSTNYKTFVKRNKKEDYSFQIGNNSTIYSDIEWFENTTYSFNESMLLNILIDNKSLYNNTLLYSDLFKTSSKNSVLDKESFIILFTESNFKFSSNILFENYRSEYQFIYDNFIEKGNVKFINEKSLLNYLTFSVEYIRRTYKTFISNSSFIKFLNNTILNVVDRMFSEQVIKESITYYIKEGIDEPAEFDRRNSDDSRRDIVSCYYLLTDRANEIIKVSFLPIAILFLSFDDEKLNEFLDVVHNAMKKTEMFTKIPSKAEIYKVMVQDEIRYYMIGMTNEKVIKRIYEEFLCDRVFDDEI